MPTIYDVHSRQGGRETKTCPTAQIATRGARRGGGARLCQPLRSRLGGRGSTEAAIFGGDAKITVASRGPPVGGRKDARLGEPPPPRKRRLGADAKIELLSTGNSVRRSFSTRFFFCSRQFFVEFYLGRENPRGIVSNCFSSPRCFGTISMPGAGASTSQSAAAQSSVLLQQTGLFGFSALRCSHLTQLFVEGEEKKSKK